MICHTEICRASRELVDFRGVQIIQKTQNIGPCGPGGAWGCGYAEVTCAFPASVVVARCPFSCILLVFMFLCYKFQVLLHEGGTLLVCLNSIRALNAPTWSWVDDIQQLFDGLRNYFSSKFNSSSSKYVTNTVPLQITCTATVIFFCVWYRLNLDEGF